MDNSFWKYLFFTVLFISIISCKKTKVEPSVIEKTTEPENSSVKQPYYGNFESIENINFPDAESIKVDSAQSSYIVTMPAGYTDNKVSYSLKLKTGATLYSNEVFDYAIPKSTYSVNFRGLPPVKLQFKSGVNQRNMDYQWLFIYFQLQDNPEIELVSNEILISGNGYPLKFPINFKSGIGSIPTAPQPEFVPNTISIIINKGSEVLTGYWNAENQEILLENPVSILEKLINKQVKIDFSLPYISSVTFDAIKFIRGLPKFGILNYNPTGYQSLKKPGQKFDLKADGILKTNNYKASFTNDFGTEVFVPMEFQTQADQMSCTIPDGIRPGSYQVLFYENNQVVSSDVAYVSSDSVNMVASIWKGETYDALKTNPIQPLLKKGDYFFAKELFPQYYYNPQSLKRKDPILRLKSGSVTFDLQSEAVGVNWAIAGVSFSIGKFRIPENAIHGLYEATFVFPNGTESSRYWSKVKIE